MEKEQKTKTEVTLAKDHTHDGKVLKPGGVIKVRPGQVEWMKKHGVIK